MVHSGDKGKRFEREVRDLFKHALNCQARRGQQFRGGPDSPDVIVDCLPQVHVECKHVNRLSIYVALEQAIRDAGEKVPIVVHKADRKEVLVTLRFSDLTRLVRLVYKALEHDNVHEIGQGTLVRRADGGRGMADPRRFCGPHPS